MANSFGSLYVGASGLQSASHGLNTTANNLSNVNTEGYVREQVVYEDKDYRKIGNASISTQYAGLGVQVGTIVHARDIFLDKAFRSESGRHSFYDASSEAVQEVITHLQELDGQAFKDAIKDLYGAFEEFAKDPSDTVNQNLVLQKSSLFLSRAKAVQDGFEDYQRIINAKIKEDINRVNAIGEEIVDLNRRIQAIEAAHVEQAMDLRDRRDLLLDELSGLVRVTNYEEDHTGVLHIDIEGAEFLDEVTYHQIGALEDRKTGFVTPYWTHLSEPKRDYYYPVFDMETISATTGSDIGEIKALVLARGEEWSNYLSFYDKVTGEYISSDVYEKGIANSIMMNSEAELDTLIHQLATDINNILSPIAEVGEIYTNNQVIQYRDDSGNLVEIHTGDAQEGKIRILDERDVSVGTDGELPPRELFVRIGCDRYKAVEATIIDNGQATNKTIYLYNEEDPTDTSKCYTLKGLHINEDLVKQEAYLPHLKFDNNKLAVDYDIGRKLSAIWNNQDFNLNPSDTTPCSYQGFYVKWTGEIGNVGNVYKTTAASLEGTKEQIEFSRQGVIGVASDEELTIMIKYQSAYNAASRYINVVNEMIEHLITSLF
ncbi:MAG: flagellar basal body protein [Pseudobutyrivibrio sp.]|nr:flagellar basal body protein [Pseudobutyrivibrio sp.]